MNIINKLAVRNIPNLRNRTILKPRKIRTAGLSASATVFWNVKKTNTKTTFPRKTTMIILRRISLVKKLFPYCLSSIHTAILLRHFFYDSTIVPFDEDILDKLSTEQYVLQLQKVMKKLKPYERKIIYQLFWNRKSQNELAINYGISQQTMNEKVNRILAKMLKMMKIEK